MENINQSPAIPKWSAVLIEAVMLQLAIILLILIEILMPLFNRLLAR